MKKAILIFALALISATTIAQDKKPVVKDSVYRPDPKRLYTVAVTADQLQLLVQSAQAGFLPYLKTTELPMKQIDGAQQYFAGVLANVAVQFRKQYVADSLKANLPKYVTPK